VTGEGGDFSPSYWKNGVRVTSLGGTGVFGLVNDIAISDGTVYAAGYLDGSSASTYPVPTLWIGNAKKQFAVDVKGNDNVANSIAVSGRDIYLSGTYNASDSTVQACYWSVDSSGSYQRHQLPVPTGASGHAEGIVVAANAVYVSGYYCDAKNVNHPVYWKNGECVPLSEMNSSAGGWTYGIGLSSSGGVIVSGTVETTAGQSKPALWNNGERSLLSVCNASYNAEAEYCAFSE